MKLPEVLSPAGDTEKLRLAVLYGADAVYLGGGPFTMRQAARGFSEEELPRAAAFCHENGVRVYLTCNTLPRGEEADRIEDFLRAAADAKVDALIVTDLGVLAAARELVPQIPLHVSTQAGVVNWRSARALWELGAKRVILARELSLEEIRVIREKTPPELELEAFVHGAMCMAFSGRCLISDYLADRDPNRGRCAQPCRWKYRLVEEKRPGEYYPIVEDEDGSWFFNAKDLCMIEHLDELYRAGITSFKIEGRQKSAYYAAVVTNAYRAARDRLGEEMSAPPAWAVEEVLRVSHRPYSTGFYFGRPQRGQDDRCGDPVREWEVAAVAEEWRDGWLWVSQRNRFRAGDELELLSPGEAPRAFLVEALRDKNGAPIESAPHPTMRVGMPCSVPVRCGALLRRRRGRE